MPVVTDKWGKRQTRLIYDSDVRIEIEESTKINKSTDKVRKNADKVRIMYLQVCLFNRRWCLEVFRVLTLRSIMFSKNFQKQIRMIQDTDAKDFSLKNH